MRQLFSAFEELYEAIRHADSGIKQSAMPTGPCAASRLGTVAASAVYGQSETMTLESKLSAPCSHLVRAWRIANAQSANAQKKIGNISVPDSTAEDGT